MEDFLLIASITSELLKEIPGTDKTDLWEEVEYRVFRGDTPDAVMQWILMDAQNNEGIFSDYYKERRDGKIRSLGYSDVDGFLRAREKKWKKEQGLWIPQMPKRLWS